MDIKIVRGGSNLPTRLILHGVEGVGKSSFGAYAPNPLFLMTRGETGLLTLIDSGRVPDRDHFEPADSWFLLMRQLDYVLNSKDVTNKTLVLDVLGGAARLCEEQVCNAMFKGDPLNYGAYGKGVEVTVGEWLKLFAKLDEIREKRRMAVVLLTHTIVKPFKNPEGDDYDRYVPEMNEKLWRQAAKWADVILFANFETFAKKERGELKAKGNSSGRRIMFTERTAAYDAKNRLGLPCEIDMGRAPEDSFPAFLAAAKAAKAAGLQHQATPAA